MTQPKKGEKYSIKGTTVRGTATKKKSSCEKKKKGNSKANTYMVRLPQASLAAKKNAVDTKISR